MLPNLVIIGAEKAGTSSMHFYLAQHPEIYMAEGKELNFFIADRTWSRGIKWYESKFETNQIFKVYGESSPLYTAYPEGIGVAERMHEIIPNAKLIYMVRDPIERMVSDYFHHFYQRKERRSWEEIMQNLANSSYMAGSMYYARLKPFLEFYPRDQILILPLKDLQERRMETLQQVFRFLDVDESFFAEAFFEVKNEARDRHQRSALTSAFISFFYHEVGMRYLPVRLKETLKRLFDKPFTTAIQKPVLNRYMRQRLEDLLRNDIHEFRNWSKLPLDDWCC